MKENRWSENRLVGIATQMQGCDPLVQQEIARHMSPSMIDGVRALTPRIDPQIAKETEGYDWLSRIHSSHLIPFLEPLALADVHTLILPLSSEQQEAICAELNLPLPEKKGSPLFSQYLRGVLMQQLTANGPYPLPVEMISHHRFNSLLKYSYSQIEAICYLLSMFDLSSEIKKVIKSATLKALEESLTQMEKQFLQKVRKDTRVLHFCDMGLNNWNLEEAPLRKTLLIRGINRLAKGVFPCRSEEVV